MDDNMDFIINDKNITKQNISKKGNSKKIKFTSKNKKISLIRKNSKVINIMIFEIISISLIKAIFSQYYMKIKVNKIGYNQIISDYYNGALPSKVLINGLYGLPILMRNKKVNIESTNDVIHLIWSNDNISPSYMFNNITSITSVNIYMHVSGNISYMFYNCKNLETFTYEKSYDKKYPILDMRGMFYNCYSLKSLNLSNFYLNLFINRTYTYYDNTTGQDETLYDYYDDLNLSFMFYNCRNLNLISFGSNDVAEVIDMKSMFYNCYSLISLNISRILTNDKVVDLSYMFYNCSSLETITRERIDSDFGGLDSNNIYAKDMQYMFYNCKALSEIKLDYLRSNTYITIFRLFYNCNNLEKLDWNFNNLYINDAREVFYNCNSLKSLIFYPKGTITCINMTKMFYDCTGLQTLILNNIDNYVPIDLSYTFYNCKSLISLQLNKFQTDELKEIRYMMTNCISLTDFSIIDSNFSNILITNMRGIFKNCESIVSLDLSSFYTPNVEVMWDMFKGCKKLKYLIMQNFDTSNVVDMESMFEGCSELEILSLENFRTQKVHYMNKMFSECISLKSLNFHYISSASLGTMHQMFYKCEKLEYLNVYSLTDNKQSVFEMFEGASSNFTFCLSESEKASLIFEEIKKKINTLRDCSNFCYGEGKERIEIRSKKLCCPFVEYNESCYDKCPPRTHTLNPNDKKCEIFLCTKYYNFTQDGCTDNIPEGFYENDTELKTIDKCPDNCKTCEKTINQTFVHCLSCNEDLPYLYFGKCLNSCKHDFYENEGVLTCRCITKECSNCSEESLENDLCVECAPNYYTKSNEVYKNFKKCYQNPPKYYYNSSQFYPCYSSCQTCETSGNKAYHHCLTCDSNHSFAIIHNETGVVTYNCYENCTYRYFFKGEDYECTKDTNCPDDHLYLIPELRRCVDSCKYDGYIKRLKNECYKECPADKSEEGKENVCKNICPYDSPFELVIEEICVGSCTIMERYEKKCVTNNIGNRTNLQIQEIIHDDIISDLTNKFDYSNITDNNSIIIEENKTTYEILTTRNKNKNNFGECESILREYYDIDGNQSIYILKMDTYLDGKTGPTVVYELFSPSDLGNLEQLDISICEGEKVSISYSMYLENPELYDKNNPIYSDICHPYTSEDGLDMTLSSKQQDYVNNNKSLCEENCEYTGYDKINQFVQCNCDIKDSSTMISDIKVDKSKLYDFMGIDKLANFDVLKCVNLIVQKEYLIGNIGFYAFIPSFICYFFAVIIFYAKDLNAIKIKINNLVIAKKNLEYLRDRKKKLIEDEIKNRKDKYVQPVFLQFMNKKKMIKSEVNRADINIYNVENDKLITNEKSSTKFKLNDTIEEKVTEEDIPQDSSAARIKPPTNTIINVNNIQNDIIIVKKGSNNANPPKTSGSSNKSKKNKVSEDLDFLRLNVDFRVKIEQIEKEENKMKVFLKKNDKELNDLNFKSAVKNDNRTFGRMYFSFLKAEHLLVRIINKKDYNSMIVKLYLFLYNTGLSYTVNGLFFDDEAIEQIFADGGQFNFINQIPQIIYSSIISFILFSILDYLALTEDSVLGIKKAKVAKVAEKKANDIIRTLLIKYVFFFILSFFFMLACWYYMTCFCAVYRNTQFHLLKDTLISFGISLLSPFATKLVPTFFRLYGLRKRSQIIFKIGQFSQLLL